MPVDAFTPPPCRRVPMCAVLQAVANQPCVAIIDASLAVMGYGGGIFRARDADGNPLCSSNVTGVGINAHAVLVVGYTADAWIIKNSCERSERREGPLLCYAVLGGAGPHADHFVDHQNLV